MTSWNTVDRLNDGAIESITGPKAGVAKIYTATLGSCGTADCDLGVINDGSTSEREPKAIKSGCGGEVKGPWIIDEDIGLIVTNNSQNEIVYSFLGEVLP